MKKSLFKPITLIGIVTILCIATLCLGIGMRKVVRDPDRLSPEKVAELRNTYPLRTETPAMIDFLPTTLDECVKSCDTFAVVKIESISEYSVDLQPYFGAGEKAIYEKNGGKGVTTTAAFTQYNISVEEDIFGTFSQETIQEPLPLSISNELRSMYPEMKVGDRFVLSLWASTASAHIGTYDTLTESMYYLTDDNYALSVSPVESAQKHTGLSLEDLKRELTAIRDAR